MVCAEGTLRRQAGALDEEYMFSIRQHPDGKIIRVLLPVGVPEETWPQKGKKPFESRAWFNRYGASGS